jgi:hypothetical protein
MELLVAGLCAALVVATWLLLKLVIALEKGQ